MSVADIVGALVGSVVGAGAIFGLIWWHERRRKS